MNITTNQKAFLDMIAISELGKGLIAASDNGYNVIVGSTAQHPILFHDYSAHPNLYNAKMNSTAAGRYQLLYRYYKSYRDLLGLPDFSPDSQDAIALQQIKECHAITDIDAGYINTAIIKCSNIWASLPGNNYGQHQNKTADLIDAFIAAGGVRA